MRAVLALAVLTVLIQPTPPATSATTIAQANDCTGPNCPPKRDCEHEKEKTIS